VPLYEESCRDCGLKFEHIDHVPNEVSPPCPKCGGVSERLYSLAAVKLFKSFRTRNIYPDGMEVEVRSQSQLSQLCNEYHVNPVPDIKIDPPKHVPTVKFPD
jgi:putative FmdB family regulatory protein